MDRDPEFRWNEFNLDHCLRHGVTPEVVTAVASNDPKLFPDTDPAHAGSDFMIGPDDGGRFWTVVLLSLGDDGWRPITGWPSTNTEIRHCNGA